MKVKRLSVVVLLVVVILGGSQVASASESPAYWLSVDNLETSKSTYFVGEDIWLQPTISYGHADRVDMLYTVTTDEGASVTIATAELDNRIGNCISAIAAKCSTPGTHRITFSVTIVFYVDGSRHEITNSYSIDREIIPIAEIKLLKS